ncbi:MAG: STM4013/SEN3800 family hydrolase [Thermonemataceae bacterium]
MYSGKDIIATQQHILWVTLDTLRYDVAQELFLAGKLPNFSRYLPATGWVKRHTPGSFTFAAHQAFFAGFLPTPAQHPKQARLFAADFQGSVTTNAGTFVFQEDNIVAGLQQQGYHTICIGGVGFFNKRTALGKVLPSYFQESHWEEAMGVTAKDSTQQQFTNAIHYLERLPEQQKVFLFINISAIHQPNYFYLPAAKQDNLQTHAAALQYVDSQLPILMDFLVQKGSFFCIFCADHGTAYGEDGYIGHRLAHPSVWEIPYVEFMI